MDNRREIVLVGDPNEARFNWFRQLLYEKYGKDAERVETLRGAIDFVRNSPNFFVSLIFLSDDLPTFVAGESEKNPWLNFHLLEMDHLFDYAVCIVTEPTDPRLDGIKNRPYHVHLRSFPPTEDDRQRIITELGALGDVLPPLVEISKIAEITKWDHSLRTLKRQIRALSGAHELADGENHLFRLIRNCLNCNNVERIEVKQLGQGKSGASVFRLIVSETDKITREYVLKLGDAPSLWKLESEVRGHLEATKTHSESYTRHVAALRRPVFSIKSSEAKPEHQYIVNSGQWYGIHYDFLGGTELGTFIDLASALTALPSELREKTKGASSMLILNSVEANEVLNHRLKVLGAVLDGLCDLWYAKENLGDRRVETVWELEDAPEREFISLPPYRLTRRVKFWVQDFLDSHDAALGTRLFPDWNNHLDSVLNFVGDELNNPGLLAKRIPLTLSSVHGDLNANNILLWLKYERYPFVIDLPFYQKDGHALQDFARLETEIKFALMDRQEESPLDKLIAFDNSVSQVPLWREMEDLLLEDAALDPLRLTDFYLEDCNWRSAGFQDNVTLCFRAILLIRKKASEIQQKILKDKPAPAAFADEYLPALLYSTVRSIGYPSLSVFKRLLACYSSSLILNKLSGR